MQQDQLTEKDAALFERVYVPAFIRKCAQNGRQIPDTESLSSALETTALVMNHLQTKQGNSIKAANASIKQALGVNQKQAELNEHNERLAQAFEIGKDAEVRNAILNQRTV
jgi:hypothetical protein